jgi:hypothetical protein
MAEKASPRENPPRAYSDVVGMDPFADWLLGKALDDFVADGEGGPDAGEASDIPIPFLIELPFGSIEALNNARDATVVILTEPEFVDEEIGVAEGLALISWFETIRDDDEPRWAAFRDAPKRIVLSRPLRGPETLDQQAAFWSERTGSDLPSPGGWPDKAVFVAVIDDGIAFAHERFRLPGDQSRIEAYLDLNPPYLHLWRAHIEQHMADSKVGGELDEDEVYTRARLLDYSFPHHKTAAWRRAHGTHVLDLAAGEEPERDVRNRPIVAVQLPSRVVAHTVGDHLLDFFLSRAIRYVLNAVDKLAGTAVPRVVINVSFGYIAGPHDGTGVLERLMENRIGRRAPHTQIVLAAGNAHASRCHAEIDFAAADVVRLDWILQPNDRTHSLLQIWLPGEWQKGVDRIRVIVRTPDGRRMRASEAPGSMEALNDGAAELRFIQYWTGDHFRSLFVLSTMPTDRPEPTAGKTAPAGLWRLRFEPNAEPMDGVAHVWVQRDDSLYGYPQRGRQAYVDDETFVVFDDRGRRLADDWEPPQPTTPSGVRRSALLNAIASGSSVIAAGGYFDRTGTMPRYSSGGPNTPPEHPPASKPDALLPSEGSIAHPGVLAAGSRSGGLVAMSGTSVAAPQLTRLVADALAAAPQSATRAEIAAAAVKGDTLQPPLASLPQDRRAGRLRPKPRTPEIEGRYWPDD